MKPQEGISRLEENFREQLRVKKMEEDLIRLKEENQRLKEELKKYKEKTINENV
tara:strand:+ start:8003 stop:8164 length:162 start_codon:yes stop_codon:yes gene_type:complete